VGLIAGVADTSARREWTFPLTGSGKIQKFRLRGMWQAGDVTPL